jgi:hypothetical protein
MIDEMKNKNIGGLDLNGARLTPICHPIVGYYFRLFNFARTSASGRCL